MMLLSIRFPNIDPVMLHLGPISIRWYGFCYLLGFLAGYLLLRRQARSGRLPLDKHSITDFLSATMLGVILGGRLGYVCIYKPGFYLHHLLEIPAIWDGGMSFHGGLLGVGLATWIFCRKRQVPTFSVIDAACIAATPGIFFVRIANFINQELWGSPTDLPWGVIFNRPEAGPLPRHPSEIYEALLEGAVMLPLLLWLARKPAFKRRSSITWAFLVLYGSFRFLIEFVRVPDAFLGRLLGPFSMGQILCSFMIVGGLFGLRHTLAPASKVIS